jgi:hypothetical protein
LTEDEDLGVSTVSAGRGTAASPWDRHGPRVQTLEGLPVIVSDFVQGVTLKDLLEVRRLAFRGQRSWWRRWLRRWITPTRWDWFIATSSQPTSCWSRAAKADWAVRC